MLRLLAWLAGCDGEVAPEELELLERLVARSLLAHHTGGDPEGAAAGLVATSPAAADIAELVAALESPRQRQLLACLGRRMVTCHRSNGEGRGGNPAEQAALEQLLGLLENQGGGHEARALTDHQLQGRRGSPLLPPYRNQWCGCTPTRSCACSPRRASVCADCVGRQASGSCPPASGKWVCWVNNG
jgi:hypothetical protein